MTQVVLLCRVTLKSAVTKWKTCSHLISWNFLYDSTSSSEWYNAASNSSYVALSRTARQLGRVEVWRSQIQYLQSYRITLHSWQMPVWSIANTDLKSEAQSPAYMLTLFDLMLDLSHGRNKKDFERVVAFYHDDKGNTQRNAKTLVWRKNTICIWQITGESWITFS